MHLVVGILVAAVWIAYGINSWKRAQRDREAQNQPRTMRDDFWLIVAGVVVVGVLMVPIVSGPARSHWLSRAATYAIFLAAVAGAYFVFHRLGQD